MTDKESIEILTQILKKYPLTSTEEDAVRGAIGVLGWTKLAENRIEKLGESRKKLEGEEL